MPETGESAAVGSMILAVALAPFRRGGPHSQTGQSDPLDDTLTEEERPRTEVIRERAEILREEGFDTSDGLGRDPEEFGSPEEVVDALQAQFGQADEAAPIDQAQQKSA